MVNRISYSNNQLSFLVLLRWLIGWHFLYEGIVKIANPAWTAKNYLASTDWLFSGIFNRMADNETMMSVVDLTNQWGLALIGIGLILGLLSRYALIGGVVLLLFYYVAHPPLFATGPIPVEGSYLFVNKNLIEACAMLVLLYFPTSHIIGLDRFFVKH
ncbi:MAG: hypothetical protein ABFS32_11205 [Bacteroidota bacterium]